MADKINIPIITKPFEEFGWRWATPGIASYLNNPVYLKTVLDAILINGNGSLNQTLSFKKLIHNIGINKYGIDPNKIDQISKESKASDVKNIIENSANYWYNLNLLDNTGRNAKVSEIGIDFLIGNLSNLDFVSNLIESYEIPSKIYSEPESILFKNNNISFKPLKIIIDLLLYLDKTDANQAYITEKDLNELIVPLSIIFTEANIKEFAKHLINYRSLPDAYNQLPNCTSQYTDDKGLRMLNEFLYFLECFDVLESDIKNIRKDDKKYKLNTQFINSIQGQNHLVVKPTKSKNIIEGFNKIYFGAPGTGKSYAITEFLKENMVLEKNYSRVTFHPDYDYHSFVGGYQPFTDSNDNDKIKYKFIPQIFIELYIKAWSSKEEFYLIIEEINRGNCAEIFGDIFQLLDRNPEYNIEPSFELKEFLIQKESELNQQITDSNSKIKLLFNDKLQMPSNLSILASMNTSDQSLFPMDSAFKRRWDWQYIPINIYCNSSNFVIKISDKHSYSWLNFLEKVNKKIYNVTKSEDKQIGNWFINASKMDNTISKELFINKVLFYLWNDVFKDEIFHSDNIFIERDESGSKVKDISFNNFYNTNEQEYLLIHLLEKTLELKPNDVSTITNQGYNQNTIPKIVAEPITELSKNES